MPPQLGCTTSSATVPSSSLPSQTVSNTGRARCLMLHGRAADKGVMWTLMRAAGWLKVDEIDWVCLDAIHSSPPQPHLYRRLEEVGYYPGAGGCFEYGIAVEAEHDVEHDKDGDSEGRYAERVRQSVE
eukprot:352429-Prymnesium_polylepis.1